MPTLYVIGTPIGNLEDITLRAIRILKESDVIACEDTRVTKRLLDRYEIKDKKLIAFNEEKSGVSVAKIISILEDGKNVAYVSDAGTPAISDPGARLVRSVQEAGFKIEVIPGPSALTSAISISGLDIGEFVFLGFLPHKKGRETLFKEISESKRTMIFYESTHRLEKTLEKLASILDGGRRIAVGKELTKIHEAMIVGSAESVFCEFKSNPQLQKGEFVVIVEGC